jgi:hypothetical protein
MLRACCRLFLEIAFGFQPELRTNSAYSGRSTQTQTENVGKRCVTRQDLCLRLVFRFVMMKELHRP